MDPLDHSYRQLPLHHMHTNVVEVNELTKTYGSVVALNAVTLSVPKGSVYGLVGPNGAGKTTLLGILAGLRSSAAGTFSVATNRISVLPDTPKFEPWMTARETVQLAATLGGVSQASEPVGAVLERTGLTGAADRRVSGFSRGMLQRLGIATAVVSSPDLLLLDEPAAALDPQGRREVLDLVSELRGESTVIFSSHILDDVQEVCDEIAILTRGSLVYQGTLDGLVRDVAQGYKYRIEIRGDTGPAARALRACNWITQIEAEDSVVFVSADSKAVLESDLVPLLADVGVPVVSIGPVEQSLEDVFLDVTR
jgi:ABC-2 type transport system ATP-binding protein